MKRKPLQESPSDECVCSHSRKEHYQAFYQANPSIANKMKKQFGSYFDESKSGCAVGWDIKSEVNCHCDKFLDMRHCKIDYYDDILQYCIKHPTDIIQADMVFKKIGSLATVSRRMKLFELLKLITRDGLVSWNYTSRASNYFLDKERLQELIQRNIIN